MARHARYREALTETAIVTNAALTAYSVQQELHDFDPHELRVVYGVYLLGSHEIWAPTRSSTEASGLAEPPTDRELFTELGEKIVSSERIASLLTA